MLHGWHSDCSPLIKLHGWHSDCSPLIKLHGWHSDCSPLNKIATFGLFTFNLYTVTSGLFTSNCSTVNTDTWAVNLCRLLPVNSSVGHFWLRLLHENLSDGYKYVSHVSRKSQYKDLYRRRIEIPKRQGIIWYLRPKFLHNSCLSQHTGYWAQQRLVSFYLVQISFLLSWVYTHFSGSDQPVLGLSQPRPLTRWWFLNSTTHSHFLDQLLKGSQCTLKVSIANFGIRKGSAAMPYTCLHLF